MSLPRVTFPRPAGEPESPRPFGDPRQDSLPYRDWEYRESRPYRVPPYSPPPAFGGRRADPGGPGIR
jgi:hypothetical protein